MGGKTGEVIDRNEKRFIIARHDYDGSDIFSLGSGSTKWWNGKSWSGNYQRIMRYADRAVAEKVSEELKKKHKHVFLIPV